MADYESILERVKASAQRIRNLDAHLRTLFVGKDEIIHLMCVSTAAREPLLLVGEPGTAKSDLVVQFCELLGVRRGTSADGIGDAPAYFEFLLTPFTEPSEVFGPVKIDDYTQKQVYARNSAGMLQEATVAFLDEVFKANSAILNSLLTILNERKFYEGGRAVTVPLVVLFGATNEVPSTDELAALFDRFTLRVECLNVREEAQMRGLLRLGSRRESLRCRRTLGESVAASPSAPMPGLEDFSQVFRAAIDLLEDEQFHRDHVLFLDALLTKIRAIREDGLTSINDRKTVKLLKLMAVNALLEARPIGAEDHQLLEYVWDNPHDLDARRKLRVIARDR
jgi:MoxR-like ATPase